MKRAMSTEKSIRYERAGIPNKPMLYERATDAETAVVVKRAESLEKSCIRSGPNTSRNPKGNSETFF